MHIVIASAVRETPAVLRHFLTSLLGLELDRHAVRFVFIDAHDRTTSSGQEASDMLAGFCALSGAPAMLLPVRFGGLGPKDRLLRLAMSFVDFHTDAVLLLDSDLVLHPETVNHLAGLAGPVVASVFHTEWTKGAPLPNVWSRGVYEHDAGLLADLRKPGVYRVGGVCGCVFIRREAIERGARFEPVDNLPGDWSEDRHFGVRARVLGIDMMASTYLPPVHLYRPEDVAAFEAPAVAAAGTAPT